MPLNSNSIHPITEILLEWYSIHKRDLPWRANPVPYHIWLAEIVFQQTRIEQGMAYYHRLVNEFPSVEELAKAEEKRVLKAWEGLGYYSRARNLHHSAKQIVEKFEGRFPSNYQDILSLKGVGLYTAAAIASVAFKLPYPAIDGNVLRLSSRLFAIEESIDNSKTRDQIETELLALMSKSNPGDFNQAMMEYGSLVCKPRNPLCESCVLKSNCLAFSKGIQHRLPFKKKKVKVKELFFNYYVFVCRDETIIEKREEGIWKNMYQFPLEISSSIHTEEEFMQVLIKNKKIKYQHYFASKVFKHLLSHRKINAKFWMIQLDSLELGKNQLKISIKDLDDYPMPKLLINFLNSEEAMRHLHK